MPRKYVSRAPRTTREQYLDDISLAINQTIDISTINVAVESDIITVGSTPVKAQINSEAVEGRHTLEIINDSSFLVYFGFHENIQAGVDTVLINSGTSVTLSLNPNRRIDVWVVAPDIDVEIKVIEVA